MNEEKKRLIGDKEHTITKGEIAGWNRGKQDALKSKILAASGKLSVERAIALIKAYAKLGDEHHAAMQFNITPSEVRKILSSFSIQSIEDARQLIREGIIAEYDNAKTATSEASEIQRRIDQEEGQQRLEVFEEQQRQLPLTLAERDQNLTERQTEAQRKNKEDKLRQLIAEGIDPKTNTSDFRIPIHLISEFKAVIPHGVGQLQRRFGGTQADIVNEIKRLSPDTVIEMLRP